MPPKRKAVRGVAKAVKKLKKSEDTIPQPQTPQLRGISVNDGGPVVFIEHCRSCTVFKRQADELFQKIVEHLPKKQKLQLLLNSSGISRRGSFEIAVGKTSDDPTPFEIWSGMKRGPPRSLKFPAVEVIIDKLFDYLGITKVNK